MEPNAAVTGGGVTPPQTSIIDISNSPVISPNSTLSDKTSEIDPSMTKGGHALRATAKTVSAVCVLLGGLGGRALRVGVAVVAIPMMALTVGALSAFDKVVLNDDIPFSFGILPVLYTAFSTVYHGATMIASFVTGKNFEDERRTDNIGQRLSPFSDKGKVIKFETVATMFSSITRTDIPYFGSLALMEAEKNGNTDPIARAVAAGHSSEVQRLLTTNHTNNNPPLAEKLNTLTCTVEKEENGEKKNVIQGVLATAIDSNNAEIVKALIDENITLTSKHLDKAISSKNENIVSSILDKYTGEITDTQFTTAIRSGNVKIMNSIQSKYKGNIEEKHITAAINSGNLGTVRSLTQDITEITEKTFAAAIESGNPDMVDFFIRSEKIKVSANHINTVADIKHTSNYHNHNPNATKIFNLLFNHLTNPNSNSCEFNASELEVSKMTTLRDKIGSESFLGFMNYLEIKGNNVHGNIFRELASKRF